MRQRTATDIQTESKRKRFSKQNSLLKPIADGIFVSRIVQPTKLEPEIEFPLGGFDQKSTNPIGV
jgi:hypothetical protein